MESSLISTRVGVKNIIILIEFLDTVLVNHHGHKSARPFQKPFGEAEPGRLHRSPCVHIVGRHLQLSGAVMFDAQSEPHKTP